MSSKLLLERMRRVCRQPPVSEWPNACGLLSSLEVLQASEEELPTWFIDRASPYEECPDVPRLLYAREQPLFFKVLMMQLRAAAGGLMAANLPLTSGSNLFHIVYGPHTAAEVYNQFTRKLRQPGGWHEQELFLAHALSLLTLNPLEHEDAGWLPAAFRSTSLAIDALCGSRSRQAAGQQLARNGLVPVLPAAGEQPAQQAPLAAEQLSPAAAALQAALQAHVPGVSLEDVQQCALTLRLFVGADILQQLSPTELATLLTDSQLLLNRCAASGDYLMAAERAAAVLLAWLEDKNGSVQLRTLVRIGQLLVQAAARAEAHQCWYTAASLTASHAAVLVRLVGVHMQHPPLLQQADSQDLPAADVAQQALQLIERSRSFDSRIKPWAPNTSIQDLVVQREFMESFLRHVLASNFTSLPNSADLHYKAARLPTCDGCHRQALHVRKCAQCRSECYCSQACQVRHWKHGGHKEECASLAAQRRQSS